MDDTFRFRFRQSHRFIAAAERIPNLKYWSAGRYKNFWNYPKCVPAMATSRWLSISLMALKLVYLNKTKSIFTSKKSLSECCVFLKRRLHGRLRVLELGHRAVRVKCCPVNKTLVSGFISLREMIKLSSILSLKCHQHDIGGEKMTAKITSATLHWRQYFRFSRVSSFQPRPLADDRNRQKPQKTFISFVFNFSFFKTIDLSHPNDVAIKDAVNVLYSPTTTSVVLQFLFI